MLTIWASGIRNTARLYLSVCLSLCLSVCLSVYHLPIYLSSYLSFILLYLYPSFLPFLLHFLDELKNWTVFHDIPLLRQHTFFCGAGHWIQELHHTKQEFLHGVLENRCSELCFSCLYLILCSQLCWWLLNLNLQSPRGHTSACASESFYSGLSQEVRRSVLNVWGLIPWHGTLN